MITGGTGSFGHQMIIELMQYKPKLIRIFSRDEDKQHNLKQELLESSILDKIQFVIGDVRDYDRMYSVTKDMDIIFMQLHSNKFLQLKRTHMKLLRQTLLVHIML